MQQQSSSLSQIVESTLHKHSIVFTHHDSTYHFAYPLNSSFESLYFDITITDKELHLHAYSRLICKKEISLLKFINSLNQTFSFANFAYSSQQSLLIYSSSVPCLNIILSDNCITALLSFPLLYFDSLSKLFINVSNGSILPEEAIILSTIQIQKIFSDTKNSQ